MGAITGLLGLGGGPGGTSADLTNPTNKQQLAGYGNISLGTLTQQQALLNQLAQQNGLGNQSQVYGQLQGIANGTGPNPALQQLRETTGQNVAATNALIAGARGANANPGLIARQAAMQGANTQQQAVGQGATLAAEQQLGAIQAAGNLANQQAQQQIGQSQYLNQAAQNAYGQQIGAQQGYNAAAAGIAQDQAKGQQGLFGSLGNAAGAALGVLAEGGEVPGPKSHFGQMLAQGGNVGSSLKAGGHVPGKPAVGGAKDSYANDTVKALLSPGEIVLPRSVTQGGNPVGDAARFVQAVLAKKGRK